MYENQYQFTLSAKQHKPFFSN